MVGRRTTESASAISSPTVSTSMLCRLDLASLLMQYSVKKLKTMSLFSPFFRFAFFQFCFFFIQFVLRANIEELFLLSLMYIKVNL